MDLSYLDQQQKSAVLDSLDKNTVVVAGAGAGKTRVLTARVRYLIDECMVNQENIMVVTFTNKAVKELKTRLSNICGDLSSMWIGTFHSICLRLLRDYGYCMNINNIRIISKTKSKEIMNKVLDNHMIPYTTSNYNKYISKISNWKNDLKDSNKAKNEAKSSEEYVAAEIYEDYKKACWVERLFDFDDLIVYAVILLANFPAIKQELNDKFKYIMCDESQDTNGAQFNLLKSLAGDNNLFLVGDDDQSIYSFRKAKPQYLLNFKLLYPDSEKIMLEQNYRSTQTIVNASNRLVKNNTIRYNKTCFSENEEGDPIILKHFDSPIDEADWVAREISLLKDSINLNEIAILCRTKAQSGYIEKKLIEKGLKYKSIGMISFCERKEIKDIVSFLSIIEDCSYKDGFIRAIGQLPSIGPKTIDKIIEISNLESCNLNEATSRFCTISKSQKQINSLNIYLKIINNHPNSIEGTIQLIINELNIMNDLINEDTEEANSRIDNINELIEISKEFKSNNIKNDLKAFLDIVSLSSSADNDTTNDRVNIITIHASKGLEFEVVFIVGVEERILPHFRSNSPEEVEEERRLMYVAMSRAKQLLYITYCRIRGDLFQTKSRFIDEIPNEFIINL